MATRVTAPEISRRKHRVGSSPIVMVTAYDTPFARIVDDAGVDIILVGDSLANTTLGYENTLHISMDDMVHHTAAVARANPRALVVGDLPWMSYHTTREAAVENAARLIRAGAGAVKLEGGQKRAEVISAIIDAEIPVMGHLGLTPQSINTFGGLRVQAKDEDSAAALIADARALAVAGCFCVVLEGIPDDVAIRVTDEIDIPTIGIGAGPHCDGQVLVLHDILGLSIGPAPKFVRRYVDLGAIARDAVAAFANDVRTANYPSESETYHSPGSVRGAVGETGASSAG